MEISEIFYIGDQVEISCRGISRGKATGSALISKEPFSFLGGVDPETGIVIEKGHELEGCSLKDAVMIFPNGRGSTVGSYVLLQLRKNGVAPSAIVNEHAEPIIAVGAIISHIPMVDMPEKELAGMISNGDLITVDGDKDRIIL